MGPTPLRPVDDPQRAALERALVDVYDRAFVRWHGYTPWRSRGGDPGFGARLVRLRIRSGSAGAGRLRGLVVRRPTPSGARAVSVKLRRDVDPALVVWVHHAAGDADADLDSQAFSRRAKPGTDNWLPAQTAPIARKALRYVAAEIEGVILPWFDADDRRRRMRR